LHHVRVTGAVCSSECIHGTKVWKTGLETTPKLNLFSSLHSTPYYSSCGTWWHTRINQNSSFPETDESI